MRRKSLAIVKVTGSLCSHLPERVPLVLPFAGCRRILADAEGDASGFYLLFGQVVDPSKARGSQPHCP
jgi:hypothetical protein